MGMNSSPSAGTELNSTHEEWMCRAIKQCMVLGLHVGVYSKDDTMAHTRRLVVTS